MRRSLQWIEHWNIEASLTEYYLVRYNRRGVDYGGAAFQVRNGFSGEMHHLEDVRLEGDQDVLVLLKLSRHIINQENWRAFSSSIPEDMICLLALFTMISILRNFSRCDDTTFLAALGFVRSRGRSRILLGEFLVISASSDFAL
jgi:hypothetical protein